MSVVVLNTYGNPRAVAGETVGGAMQAGTSISEADKRTIVRILKVNHAGEFGAIRIYRAQILIARRLYPDVVPFLDETLGHEIRHCSIFREAMPSRQGRPCRAMSLWGNGGWLLGFLTALMGRQGIWICTAAVEGTVHRHLEDQLAFLEGKDVALRADILAIKDEELGHLTHAERNIVGHSRWARFLNGAVSLVTEVMIWLSTWGDSTHMAREIASPR